MIIILFRAEQIYTRSSVQSTVRFLQNRIPLDHIDTKMCIEWGEARYWWEKRLKQEDRDHFLTEYMLAS